MSTPCNNLRVKNDFIKQHHDASEQILHFFIKKYFGKIEEQQFYWIGSQVGAVAHINDHFFDLLEMIEFMKYSASRKQLFDYYDYALNEEEQDRTPLPFRFYKKNLRK